MSKTFRPYEPDQISLMPASMRDWLPSDHLAYFISDIVDNLDLSAIMERYSGEDRGYPPYHPAMMVKVLLYAYCIGVASSRKIEKRLCEDIAFRVLAANNTPDFRTISDFRKDHLKALAGLFLQVLKLCQKAGLVKLGHVALDGTKIKANASKHKAMSYKRMKEEEVRLEAEVAELMKKAESVDEESLQEASQRSLNALNKIIDDCKQGIIVIVIHRVITKLLECALLGLENSHFWNIEQDTCGVTTFLHNGIIFVLKHHNDISFLKTHARRTLSPTLAPLARFGRFTDTLSAFPSSCCGVNTI